MRAGPKSVVSLRSGAWESSDELACLRSDLVQEEAAFPPARRHGTSQLKPDRLPAGLHDDTPAGCQLGHDAQPPTPLCVGRSLPGDRTAVAVINDLHPEGILGYLRLEVEVGVGVNDPVGDQLAGQQESGKRQDAVDVLTREELTDKLPGRRNARGLGGKGDSCRHGKALLPRGNRRFYPGSRVVKPRRSEDDAQTEGVGAIVPDASEEDHQDPEEGDPSTQASTDDACAQASLGAGPG